MSDNSPEERKITVSGPNARQETHWTRPVERKIFTKPFFIVMTFALIGLFFHLQRFFFGLGAVSNLNHGYAWGFWISFDVVVGTAIGSGGYAMALLVYILNKGKLSPFVRPAILTAFLGYLMAGIAIVVDTGRYWNLYNMFRWPTSNIDTSIMVEVAISVAAYTGILFMENTPAFLERFKKYEWRDKLNKVMFVLIAFGVLFPTLHQSSLGAMIIPMGDKVSPLWQTQFLPLLFLISALFIGMGAVIFENYGASMEFDRMCEKKDMAELMRLLPYFVLVYLVIRFADLIYRGAFSVFLEDPVESISFVFENLFFIIPAIVLLSKELRYKRTIQFTMGLSILTGGVLYRFNSYLIGFDPAPGWSYFPSFGEIFVSIGLVSFEIMLYMILVKTFPILSKPRTA